jgi:hypothetical protein
MLSALLLVGFVLWPGAVALGLYLDRRNRALRDGTRPRHPSALGEWGPEPHEVNLLREHLWRDVA